MSPVDREVMLLARLEVAREIASYYADLSDKCWILSIAAGAAGTVAAVANARRARHWDTTVRELERDLLDLRLEGPATRSA